MSKVKGNKRKYKKPAITTEKLEHPEQIVIHAAYCGVECAGTPAARSDGPC